MMQQWIWILVTVIALILAVVSMLKYISIRKYKRHIEYLKKSLRMDREELNNTVAEKQYLEQEIAVIKNIYRNKLLGMKQAGETVKD